MSSVILGLRPVFLNDGAEEQRLRLRNEGVWMLLKDISDFVPNKGTWGSKLEREAVLEIPLNSQSAYLAEFKYVNYFGNLWEVSIRLDNGANLTIQGNRFKVNSITIGDVRVLFEYTTYSNLVGIVEGYYQPGDLVIDIITAISGAVKKAIKRGRK